MRYYVTRKILVALVLLILPASALALTQEEIDSSVLKLRESGIPEERISYLQNALMENMSEALEEEGEEIDSPEIDILPTIRTVREFSKKILSIGDNNNDVQRLQTYLRELGYFTYPATTTYFGPVTRMAVLSFQKSTNGILEPDGIVGPMTMEELYNHVSDISVPYPTISSPVPVSDIYITNDLTPRIMFWQGKVNQHIDIEQRAWVTDPDGVSGAGLDKLEYCKKWYPETLSVEPYKEEEISTWRERGNVNFHTLIVTSDRCVQPIE